jgi:hypothetical protein
MRKGKLMSKLKAARIVMGICWGVIGLGALGLLWFVGWLLVLWAGAHFVSFAWCMGIATVIGLVIGVACAADWASAIINKAKLDEQIEEYVNKYGTKPKWDYNYDRYKFDEAPTGWRSKDSSTSERATP